VIEGPDDAKLVYLSCYSQNGVRLGACLVRELRTDPIYFGSASVVEPIEDPATDALCDGFLRRIGYVGLCEIELKRDSRDQCVKLIEANPRYSVTSDAAPYAGVDLGWLHYLDLIGQPVELVQTRKIQLPAHCPAPRFCVLSQLSQGGTAELARMVRVLSPPGRLLRFRRSRLAGDVGHNDRALQDPGRTALPQGVSEAQVAGHRARRAG